MRALSGRADTTVNMDARCRGEDGVGQFLQLLGWGLLLVCGIWGLVICLGIVFAQIGVIGGIIALLLFPVVLTFAPWYEMLAHGNWYPFVVVYGGGALGYTIAAIGTGLAERPQGGKP